MTALYACVVMTALSGFISLGVDLGHVQLCKTELQQACDAAARYGASSLALGVTVVQGRVVAAAADNKCDGSTIVVDPNLDIEFGIWDPTLKQFIVMTGLDRYSATAVRITIRRSTARGNPIKMLFSGAVGFKTIDLTASAIATRGKVIKPIVDADCCPWLAGMPNGSTVPKYDENPTDAKAPAQSPVLVNGLPIIAGASLYFRDVDGKTSYTNSGMYGPDGETDWIVSERAVNGINTTNAPLNSLVGIFLDDRQPSTTTMAPTLDYTTQASRDLDKYYPKLKQVFYIGDGVNTAGNLQEFVVPTGATRFYLGIMDEKGWWWDNVGQITTTMMDESVQLVK